MGAASPAGAAMKGDSGFGIRDSVKGPRGLSPWRIAAVALIFWSVPVSADDVAIPAETSPSADVILVVGAEGTAEYGELFRAWADRWRVAAEAGGAHVTVVGGTETPEVEDDVRVVFDALANAAAQPERPLWLVCIGHGTFDGRSAKFNLRGPDLSVTDLAASINGLQRPTAIVLCASGSGPFLKPLSAEGRVVVTATDGGGEINFSRFGDYLSRAIGDAGADLDKDEQVSLLEAFRVATSRTEEFYKAAGRIVTEHALLDDDGDGKGTRAVALSDPETTDGRRAGQWRLVLSETELKLSPEARAERDRLELALFELRDRKSQLPEAEYLTQLETLLVQIAEIYEQAGALPVPKP